MPVIDQIIVENEYGDRVPIVAAARVAVGRIVHVAHEQSIAAATALWPAAAMTAAALEPILAYCAERRCEADHAICPGCRLRTEKLGIGTIDDFAARYSEIAFKKSSILIRGAGTGTFTAASLEQLAKNWNGEEYWFWARRVLRKLRHGIRRAGQSGEPMPGGVATPAVILVRPQLADNIGMVARAMANFGLEELRLVDPRDGWPNEKVRIAASGANFIVDRAQASPTLKDALAGFHWVCATTARQRDLAKPVMTPEQAAQEMRVRIAQGQRCAILFGPERNGLETEEVANADAAVMAPVNSNFASLNLAQAALLMSYEWMKQAGRGTLGRVTTYEEVLQPGLQTRGSPPARKEDLIGFFEHLERELDAQGFFGAPEKRPSMVQNIRSMFTRMGGTEQEIRTLRGIVKALVHAKRSRTRLP